MSVRDFIIPLLLLLCLATPGQAQGETTADRYRRASPFYVRNVIPENPGNLELVLADGSKHQFGFMGTSQLARLNPPVIPVIGQFISTPGSKWNCGIAFYQGTSFSIGLPRRYVITSGNRYRTDYEAYGTVRLVLWSGRLRYEISEGAIQIKHFRDQGRQGSFRLWRVDGSFSGTMERFGKSTEEAPSTLRVTQANFSCILIEDRDPVANRIDLTFDNYYQPGLSLPVRAEFAPDDSLHAFHLDAFRVPEQSRYAPNQFIFQIRQGNNISWPPSGEYQLTERTVDPPEIFFPESQGSRPLVMSLIYRPQQDVEMHYLPISGRWFFESGHLLAGNDTTEVWRVRGSFKATLKLEDRKIGIGSTLTKLVIDPQLDLEDVKVTKGTFDIRVRRPARKRPAWQRTFPNLPSGIGLELPNV